MMLECTVRVERVKLLYKCDMRSAVHRYRYTVLKRTARYCKGVKWKRLYCLFYHLMTMAPWG